MRSEFEKWYRDKHQITKPLYFFEDTQRYEDGFTQDAWEVWQHQQSKVDELQKRVDVQTKHIEMALVAVKDIHKSALDEFKEWDVLAEEAPKLCQHMQDLSVAVGELEQALKGGKQ